MLNLGQEFCRTYIAILERSLNTFPQWPTADPSWRFYTKFGNGLTPTQTDKMTAKLRVLYNIQFRKNDTEINEHQHGHEAGATFYALTQAHHLEPRSVCRLSTRSTRDRSSPAVLQQLAAALQPGFTPMVWVCAQNWAIYPKERKTLKGMLSKKTNWVIYIYIYNVYMHYHCLSSKNRWRMKDGG